jgi:hypothetical protein
MDRRAIVDILNELLAFEQRSLAVRLLESTVFVSQLCLDDLKIVRQMAQAGERHAARLVEAILARGGAAGPRMADAQSADLHFQELRRLRPRLIAEHQTLIRKYELATARVGAEAEMADLVSRILERHREELASLHQLGRHPAGTAS